MGWRTADRGESEWMDDSRRTSSGCRSSESLTYLLGRVCVCVCITALWIVQRQRVRMTCSLSPSYRRRDQGALGGQRASRRKFRRDGIIKDSQHEATSQVDSLLSNTQQATTDSPYFFSSSIESNPEIQAPPQLHSPSTMAVRESDHTFRSP